MLAMVQDQVGIVTDSRGHPTHSALAFPTTPSALAVSGIYVLAACADGLYAYDRATSAWVQSLPYPGGVRTAPGQQLSSAQNASGSCVLIAGYRKVHIIFASMRCTCQEETIISEVWKGIGMAKDCKQRAHDSRHSFCHMNGLSSLTLPVVRILLLANVFMNHMEKTCRVTKAYACVLDRAKPQLTGHFTGRDKAVALQHCHMRGGSTMAQLMMQHCRAQVWMLQPIALEEQARELLKAGNFDQALQLADVAAAEGAPWVEEAYAEAALLLIHGREAPVESSHFDLLWLPQLWQRWPTALTCPGWHE